MTREGSEGGVTREGSGQGVCQGEERGAVNEVWVSSSQTLRRDKDNHLYVCGRP